MTTVEQTEEEYVRASGMTAEEEVRVEIIATQDEPMIVETPEEREKQFQVPGFSRMRTDWRGEDRVVMQRVHLKVNTILDETFSDMIAVRWALYTLVRVPERDGQGVERVNADGLPIWKRDEFGDYEEDWTRLTHGQRERFLYLITNRLVDWEQRRDELWFEAMVAKTEWEELFSEGWQETSTPKKTEGDRTANGRLHSAQERYFALFQTYLSRRAESLVRGMDRLGQRIKDVHTA